VDTNIYIAPQENPTMTNPSSKTLNEIFNSHEGRRIDKWIHYLEIYTKQFEAYRGRKFNL